MAGKRSKEQDDIIERTLGERGLDAEYAGNLYVAKMQIEEFCGRYDVSVERMNSDKPIKNAFDWE